MSQLPFPVCKDYPSDVHIISLPERTILLVGIAHISRESVDLGRGLSDFQEPCRMIFVYLIKIHPIEHI